MQRHTERLRRTSYHDPVDLNVTTFGFAAPCVHESPYRQHHRRHDNGSVDNIDSEEGMDHQSDDGGSGDDDAPGDDSGSSRAYHKAREWVPHDVLLGEFALHERDVLERVFAMMDYDGSGTVSQPELVWALQRDEEISALATHSTLLSAFIQHPAHLNELFQYPRQSQSPSTALGRLTVSATSEAEVSWADFVAFCQHKYVDLTHEGVLKPPAGHSSSHQLNTPSGVSSRKALVGHDNACEPAMYREDEEEAKIRDLFAILDCDANGVLEIEELQLALADAANDREIRDLVSSCKALQPLLHETTFMGALRKFEPENPRGISEEEFVAFCLESASIAQFNGLL